MSVEPSVHHHLYYIHQALDNIQYEGTEESTGLSAVAVVTANAGKGRRWMAPEWSFGDFHANASLTLNAQGDAPWQR